jgi:hypothetical protein
VPEGRPIRATECACRKLLRPASSTTSQLRPRHKIGDALRRSHGVRAQPTDPTAAALIATSPWKTTHCRRQVHLARSRRHPSSPRKRRVLDDPVQECRVADLVARSGGTTTPSTPTSTSWKVKVSSWAFDLVSRMLNIDPSERVLLMSLLRTLSCLQEQRARLSWGLQSCHSDESPLECSAYQQARLRVPRQFVCSSLLWTFACSRS